MGNISFTFPLFFLMVFCTLFNHINSQAPRGVNYRPVHSNQSQCLVKPVDDPIKFEWMLECQNATYNNSTCHKLKINLSKISPTFCLAIQLFSEEDWIYVHLNETDNFRMNISEEVIEDNVRYRLFCYYQNMGALDFDIPPISFCLTRNGSYYSTNCNNGYANEKLDEMVGESEWNFTLRKPFHQYSWNLTKLTVDIPLRLNNSSTSSLQMHVTLIDLYNYPQKFELRFIRNPYYIIPLITNSTIETTPTWDPQCTDLTYNSRPQYYIWKLIAISAGLIEFSIILILLILKRKHHIIESRFVVPYFSTLMYLSQGVTNIFLNFFYYDPEWDSIIEELVLIVVMSVHMLQGLRYYISRLLYSRYYSNRDGLLMKILLSKFYFLIAIVLIVSVEVIVVAVLMNSLSYDRVIDFFSYFSTSCGICYLILLGIGVAIYFIVNLKFAKKLKSRKQIFKWFFMHDDTFGYNGEFLVLVLIWVIAGIYFILSNTSGDYLTTTLYISTRPISTLYINNGIGYAMYGCGKILFTIGFGLQFLFLIGMTFVKGERNNFDIQHLKEEMDIFFSKSFDGQSCIEIMKKFLISEFKLELLEIYSFLTENPKSTLIDLVRLYPQNYFAIMRYFKKSKMDSKHEVCYRESTELMVEVFVRLKQTVIYRRILEQVARGNSIRIR